MAKITDVYVCVLSWVRLFVTRWTLANQAPLSMGLCRQEYWVRLPCPPPGDLPDPGLEPASLLSPALAGGFFTTSATQEAQAFHTGGIQVVFKHHCYLCPSADQALQVMGFRAYADHHETKQHQSQVEQEENQKVHPGATKEQNSVTATEGYIPTHIHRH